MNKEAMKKFIWGRCLVLTAQKKTQFNKGKRAAYETMWNELVKDLTEPVQPIKDDKAV